MKIKNLSSMEVLTKDKLDGITGGKGFTGSFAPENWELFSSSPNIEKIGTGRVTVIVRGDVS